MNLRGRFIALALTATVLPTIAAAQDQDRYPDHLRCYKIKDSGNFLAQADFLTNDMQRQLLPDEKGCKIRVKSLEFCVPVQKDRVFNPDNPKEAPHEDFVGQALDNDFLCYKVTCPKSDFAVNPLPVLDQFGERDIKLSRTTKLCAPARKLLQVPPPPPPPSFCENSQAPMCGGTCPNVFQSCLPVSDPASGTPDCRCVGDTMVIPTGPHNPLRP